MRPSRSKGSQEEAASKTSSHHQADRERNPSSDEKGCGTVKNMIHDVVQELSRQRDEIIVQQLGDLIKHGLLVWESGPMEIVHDLYSSKLLLSESGRLVLKDQEVFDLLRKEKYSISNVDITLCLQKPKIAEHISEMKSGLSSIMNITQEDISIKATTTEKLGYVGREEGVSCYAVVLINID